jgi:Na+/H+ antiporter NhaC
MTLPTLTAESVATMVLVGAIGGAVRSLVGILKYMQQNKEDQKLRVGYLLFSIFVSAVIGGFAGALSEGNWKIAGLAGYAGPDFIEGLYKIKKSQGLET